MLLIGYQAQAAVNWNNSTTHSNIDLKSIQRELNEDNTGILGQASIHERTSNQSEKPIRISDFASSGPNSLHFLLKPGECGEEDCDTGRERAELIFPNHESHKVYWYRFSLFLPDDFEPTFPATLSLVQFRAKYDNGDHTSLVFFKHTAAGLVFNRNGEVFPNTDYQLISHPKLLGKWNEVIFNTNWNDDPKLGFFKIWINGNLQAHGKLPMFRKNHEGFVSPRIGLYNSWLDRYYTVNKTDKAPIREMYLDAIRAENTCEKLMNDNSFCKELNQQTISENRIYLGQKTDTSFQNDNFKLQPINKELDKLNIWPGIRKLNK